MCAATDFWFRSVHMFLSYVLFNCQMKSQQMTGIVLFKVIIILTIEKQDDSLPYMHDEKRNSCFTYRKNFMFLESPLYTRESQALQKYANRS